MIPQSVMEANGNVRKRSGSNEFRTTALLTVVLTVLVVFLSTADGIRIYEGTNFATPKLKLHKDLSKKSFYISKRSWVPDDAFKATTKVDKRSEEKWKDFYKTKSVRNHFPALYKIVFNGRESREYVKYTKQIPRLEEYTFCLWYKPNRLTRDHTLFSYALNKNERLLRFWLSATDSTLQMAIRENVAFKVPVNVRRNRWYHICQSWHGVFGDWQVFVDGKRIGAGHLPLYKETYVPEGGEVILSQEPVNKANELPSGLDGEIFGFNLVDEAIPGDQANFIDSQYKPNIRAVPPFKKLPPMKKTYQEIKAYISKLPSHPSEMGNGIDLKVHSSGEERTGGKRTRASAGQMKRPNVSATRTRRPPMRKVVVYNRQDRKLLPDGNSTTEDHGVATVRNVTAAVGRQPYDENYSIHSYRMGKNVRKSSNYEIYESQEEDLTAEDPATLQRSAERKARENFDLYTAREANKVYTLSSSVRDVKKPKFHFESGSAEAVGQRENGASSAKTLQVNAAPVTSERRVSEAIPVYENDGTPFRHKRDAADSTVEDQLADGFRRLPKIPDGFIDLFAKNATRTELERTLDHFFPENVTDDNLKPILVEESAESNVRLTGQERTVEDVARIDESAAVYEVPVRVVPQVTFSTAPKHVQEFDPRKRIQVTNSSDWHDRFDLTVDRRKFDVTSGTDLIMRSYGLCTKDRGSPIQNKQHLVISWAETPIKIFGGAQIQIAKNECGNF